MKYGLLALARGAHRRDGEHDDDPELHAMRTVWLAMRDEEPPDRGLAELLAAARAQAKTTQGTRQSASAWPNEIDLDQMKSLACGAGGRTQPSRSST